MTLALLLTAVTGAWAWTSGGCTVSYDNNGNMTVSKNGNGQMADIDYLYNRAWSSVASDVTNLVIEEGVTKIGKATFMNFYSITEITIPNSVTTIGDKAFTACTAVTKVTIGTGVTNIAKDAFYNIMYVTDVYCYADPANLTWNEDNNDFGEYVETKCHVPAEYLDAYKAKFNGHVHVTFVALPDPNAVEVTPVAEPAANTLQWTFEMPGSDVLLTPIYAKAAAFATTGTEPEVKTLLPEAAEGVIAGTDASLIAEGTGIVAFAGESTEVTQGTLMYAIGTSATEAPALTAFSATVPTAENVADDGATLYVWYYIQGADAPEGVAATLDNTFDDTEPACLTAQVLTNKFDITLKAANANTIEAGKATVTVGGTAATVTDGKLQGVKMGSEVKVKAATGYKFRKVEVKKGVPVKTFNCAGVELIYEDGDTWAKVIERNPGKIYDDSGWIGRSDTNLFLIEGEELINGHQIITTDKIVDPTATYSWQAG